MPAQINDVQVAQLQKLASHTLRALSEENKTLRDETSSLKEKVAAFEKRARAEKIAAEMEAKGLNTGTTFEEKVAELLDNDRLDVVEEAVGLAAPQMKLASVHEDGVEVESTGDETIDAAAQRFAAGLASLD